MWHEVAVNRRDDHLLDVKDTPEPPRRSVFARLRLDISLQRAEVGDPTPKNFRARLHRL
jgi:hypothetical protein